MFCGASNANETTALLQGTWTCEAKVPVGANHMRLSIVKAYSGKKISGNARLLFADGNISWDESGKFTSKLRAKNSGLIFETSTRVKDAKILKDGVETFNPRKQPAMLTGGLENLWPAVPEFTGRDAVRWTVQSNGLRYDCKRRG